MTIDHAYALMAWIACPGCVLLVVLGVFGPAIADGLRSLYRLGDTRVRTFYRLAHTRIRKLRHRKETETS